MSLLKCLRPHSSTHISLHLCYAITIILALTRAPHSQLFNKLRSTSIQDKVTFLYTSPSPSTFSLLYLYFLPLYIRLNQFYPSSHSCFFLFFSRSFCIDFFFLSFFVLYHFSFIFFLVFYYHFFLSSPSLSISLPLSLSISLTVSSYFLSFIFLSLLFHYPHRCPSPYKLCHRNISGVHQTTAFPIFPFLLSFSLLWYFFSCYLPFISCQFSFSLHSHPFSIFLSLSNFFYFLYYAP